jgi:hypothetical protein
MTRSPRDPWTWLVAILGAGSLANGAWMLASPAGWYAGIPAAVPDFGPLNPHFVRDIGCAYLTVGVALIWAARRAELRAPLVLVAALFFAAHAILHVHDTLRGLVHAGHWGLDLPGVYLPALLLVLASVHFARKEAP